MIDLWLLRLDGSGESVRMTHFSEFRGFGANNPVVSPDCRTMLFALRQVGGEEGNSDGLFLYDLEKSPLSPGDLCAPGDHDETTKSKRRSARASHHPGSAP